MSRKLGAFLCLLGFLGVCVAALTLSTSRPLAGLPGIQNDLADSALELVGDDLRTNAPGTEITAEGRDLLVKLPEVVSASFDREALQARLSSLDGVRSVDVVGDPMSVVPPDDAPAPVPTEAPAAEPTEVPAAEPTAEPAPEPTATAEPDPAPEPTATPAGPTLAEVVEGLDTSGVEFGAGTANLTGADQVLLDEVATQLAGQTGGPIQVQSHTDNIGDPDVNLLLSQDRADAVVGYLISKGVDSSLLSARGFGASQPIADNSTEQGRTDNQRVVFVVEGN